MKNTSNKNIILIDILLKMKFQIYYLLFKIFLIFLYKNLKILKIFILRLFIIYLKFENIILIFAK